MSVVAVFGITVASIGAGVGAYLYLKGGGSDGENTVQGDYESEKHLKSLDEALSEEDDDGDVTGATVVDDESVTEDDANPSGKTDLENVKGIGPTRAESFREEGFGTPDDLYYATDENLCEVNGIGDLTVSQIRDDIGSVDEDGYE